MISGVFVSLTAAELVTLRTDLLACLTAILTGSQSYSMSGRSFTRANLSEIKDLIAEVTYAQSLADGTGLRFVHADMSSR